MEYKLKIINKEEFKAFIKKLLAVDKFLFIKITEKAVTSSVYLPLKDAVKVVSIPFSDVFEFDGTVPDKPIKISFFNGSKIIEALNFFEGVINTSMKCGLSDDGSSYVVDDFKAYDDTYNIKFFIGDPRISFMEMSKDEMSKAFSIDHAVYRFTVTSDDISKMSAAFKLDDKDATSESKTFRFKIKKDKLYVTGQNYEMKLKDTVEIMNKDEVKEVYVYRKYIPLLDKESYDGVVCVNKVFMKSNESSTLLTFALCAGVDEDES
jgi:hypothetical protein